MKRYQVRVKASRQGCGREDEFTILADSESEAKGKAIVDAKNKILGYDSYTVVRSREMH